MQNYVAFMPTALVIKRKGDLEQISKDWEEYVNDFKRFLEVTGATGDHKNLAVVDTPCTACIKSKELIILIGGSEVKTLFNHIGKVTATDNWNKSWDKILRGITQLQAGAGSEETNMTNTSKEAKKDMVDNIFDIWEI